MPARRRAGGGTVAAYLVPQVMAYATVAGLPPVVGLWAALAPLAVYAVLGSSRQLSVGPESTTALMTATALAPLAVGDPGRYAALAAAAALLVGVICFVARLGPSRDPRRPLVPPGTGRLHGRSRGDHDRQPARQGHRRIGGRRRIPRSGAVIHHRAGRGALADDRLVGGGARRAARARPVVPRLRVRSSRYCWQRQSSQCSRWTATEFG